MGSDSCNFPKFGLNLFRAASLSELTGRIADEVRRASGADWTGVFLPNEGQWILAAVSTSSPVQSNLKAEDPFVGPIRSKAVVRRELHPHDLEWRDWIARRPEWTGADSLTISDMPLADESGTVHGLARSAGLSCGPPAREAEEELAQIGDLGAEALRNRRMIDSQADLFSSLVKFSASAIDARSPRTAGHSRRVAEMSRLAAEAINRRREGPFAQTSFSPVQVEEISYAAWLHDVGKIGVPAGLLDKDRKIESSRMELIRSRFEQAAWSVALKYADKMIDAVRTGGTDLIDAFKAARDAEISEIENDLAVLERLNRPDAADEGDYERLQIICRKEFTGRDGRSRRLVGAEEERRFSVRRGSLTREEYREVQNHVRHTSRMIEQIPFTPDLAGVPKYAALHHEHMDGSGYPAGLNRNEIPLQARIIGAADVLDALTAADRPYREAAPVEEAYRTLRREAEAGRLDPDVVELFIAENIGSLGVASSRKEDRVQSEDMPFVNSGAKRPADHTGDADA